MSSATELRVCDMSPPEGGSRRDTTTATTDMATERATCNSLVGGRYVIVTKWGYPYGGGEDYMLDTMHYATAHLRMHAVWLCYTDATNAPYTQTAVENVIRLRNDGPSDSQSPGNSLCDSEVRARTNATPMAYIVRLMGGMRPRSVYAWLRLLQPTIVHHQGVEKTCVERACALLRVPLLSGFHFWQGLVRLNPRYGNVRMLRHAMSHRPDERVAQRLAQRYVHHYVASEYMRDVVRSVCGERVASRLDVLPPMSRADKCSLASDVDVCDSDRSSDAVGHTPTATPLLLYTGDSGDTMHVTVINAHERKGGRILMHLLDVFPHADFLIVRTDCTHTAFDKALDRAVSAHQRAHLIPRVEDIRRVYRRTRLLLQMSEVDETFCRVVVEACASGVPTVCSDYGNLPNLLRTADAQRLMLVRTEHLGHNPAQVCSVWEARVRDLLCGDDADQRCAQLGAIARANYAQLWRELRPRARFCEAVSALVDERARAPLNVALLTPWCDQGLGIQNRNYARVLTSRGHRVHVFAFMPYTRTAHRADPSEWEIDGVHVHESPNVREAVSLDELVAFVTERGIDVAVFAETCWDRVFSMIAELRAMGVRTCAVPNIEIVRRDEIEKHRVFDRILLNNRNCGTVLAAHGVESKRLVYVGYAVYDTRRAHGATSAARAKPVTLTAPAKLVSWWQRIGDHGGHNDGNGDTARFLILGGMNAVSRKHVDIVARAFIAALDELRERRSSLSDGVQAAPPLRMRLLATSQCAVAELQNVVEAIDRRRASSSAAERASLESVCILIEHATSALIEHLYAWSDVVVQVSKHEGLGLGFYEAQEHGKPIVTLDVSPHNEIVSDRVGWVLQPDALMRNVDNDSACVPAAHLGVTTMQRFFVHIGSMSVVDWCDAYRSRRDALRELVPQRSAAFVDAFCAAVETV